MALKKIESDFGKKYCKTDSLLIIMLLALYKRKSRLRSADNLYLTIEHPDQLVSSAYKSITITVYDGLLDMLQKQHPAFTYSQLIASAIADYLVLPVSFYTDCISPLYTIIGSKNHAMQIATADAVDAMELPHESFTLINGCCATSSLFLGLKTYAWKSVILNDLNPLRTNFLNVIKKEPLKLVKRILETDLSFIEQPYTKNPILSAYKKATSDYAAKRANYSSVDCNADIAYKMFIIQCIDKAIIEKDGKIMERAFRFLPAHLKLQNAVITQQDCLSYLQNADYLFLYYCRSTPPKSDSIFNRADAEHIMKMKLASYFMNKSYYFQKVYLDKDTELIISTNFIVPKSSFNGKL